jgi:hypothetical protein
VEFVDEMLVVHLEDGREIRVPAEWFPRLRNASDEHRSKWRLVGHGVGVHWPDLDEDISVRGLLLPESALAHARKTA